MSKLTDILKSFAPTIAGAVGTAVGGPLGPLAALAVKALGDKLLGKPNATLPEVEAAVAGATAEQLLALRTADHAFKLEAARLGLRPMELEVEDRKDARAMQTAALSQEDVLAKRFIYYFSWFWSGFSALYVMLVTFVAIPEANVQMANIVLGFVLGTVVATILAYFYGTSMSERGKSKKSDETIARLAEAP